MAVDDRALWTLSYGLYVVSARAAGRGNGQIANTVFQVSAVPARVAVAINKENLTHALIRDGGYFAVSVLAATAPMELIGLFGFKSGRDVDKLAQVAVREGTHCPLVTEHALAVTEARVVGEVDAGTHTLFVGEVVTAELLAAGDPLTYAEYHARKGRAPKNAPTYRGEAEREAKAPAAAATYSCGVCGHTYDPALGDPEHGIAPGTRFEDLPADWECPVCGAAKDKFERE
jgi:flavin reductase (DIM6/NTAB) family NADH-FMN oxidoreductase RutF/rubredoxin